MAQEFQIDRAALRAWEIGNSDNGEELERLKVCLLRAIKMALTDKQKEYLIMYYYDGLQTTEIAKLAGKDKSTISRTINRALKRVYKYLLINFENPPPPDALMVGLNNGMRKKGAKEARDKKKAGLT